MNTMRKILGKCKDLIRKATEKARCFENIILCKGNSLFSNLILLKEKRKKKSQSTKHKKKKGGGKDGLEYSRSVKDGWLLASSLSCKNWLSINRVIKIYKKRMQMEEGFRDLKSSQYGFGFEKNHTKNQGRIRILLLIAMIASLIAWIAGYAAEGKKWHHQFQSNSTKTKWILSLFFLGCQVIKRNIINRYARGNTRALESHTMRILCVDTSEHGVTGKSAGVTGRSGT